MRAADGPIARAIEQISELPEVGIHALLGLGAFAENVFPPVPADTFIGAGGILAARGVLNPVVGFLVVWALNVLGALWVWRLGLRHGDRLLHTRVGSMLLDPGQTERLRRFYERRGVAAIFFARFLPGLRAVVPAFAGVAGLDARRVIPPLIAASLLWYGGIWGIGWAAGENLEMLEQFVQDANRALLIAAGVTLLVVGWFWRRSRGRGRPDARG